MKLGFSSLGFLAFAALGSAQTFTLSGASGTGVTASGISISSSTFAGPVAGAGTYTLSGSTSVANPFNRFDARITATRTIANYMLAMGTPSSSTTVPSPTTLLPVASTLNGVGNTAGGQTSGPVSTFYTLTNGQALSLSASVNPFGVSTSAAISIAAAQAPLATSSALSGSVATAGSTTATGSTSSLWIFDFPGNPATGTATINLGDATSTFARALNSLGAASGHRDNVRLEVKTFLDGIQVGSTAVSAANTSLGAGVGAGNQNIVFSSVPSVTLNPADVYGTTKSLTVVTSLIGTAFFGNGTSLGDYTIASSTFSGVQVQGVPEPASIAGLSLGLLAFARRRKSK
jgi:hypothetical protein